MGRSPCCDKANVKRGPWSPEEDGILKNHVERFGTGGNWIALPQKAGLKRCGKSCRLRWLNYLRPDIRHGGFTEEEDNIICSLYESMGSRWSVIASQLPGRTDNDVKNYWNTKLKKKMLADKTNLGGEHNLRARMSSVLISLSPSPSPSSSSPSSSTPTSGSINAKKSMCSAYSLSKLNSIKPQHKRVMMPQTEAGLPYATEDHKSNLDSASFLAPSVFEEPSSQSMAYNSFDSSIISWLLNSGVEDYFPTMDFPIGSACEFPNCYMIQEKKGIQVGERNPAQNTSYDFSYASLLHNPDSSQQGLYSPSVAHIL